MQAANDRKAKQQFSHKGSHANTESHSNSRVPTATTHSKSRLKPSSESLDGVPSVRPRLSSVSVASSDRKGHWTSAERSKWYQQQMPQYYSQC